MKLVYTLFDPPTDFFKACYSISEKFAGVPILTLDRLTDEQRCTVDALRLFREDHSHMNPLSIIRWIVIYEHVKDWSKDQWPIFTADWDVAVTSDLRPLFKSTKDYDVCFTHNDEGETGQPWVFHNAEPLRAFRDMVYSMVETKCPFIGVANDMAIWRYVVKDYGWRDCNLNFTPDGEAVDHNIACGHSQFEMEDGHKKIFYIDGKVHFLGTRWPAKPVPVVSMHFWNRFRPLAMEVAKQLL
jgi:hypothetical protein